MSTVILGITGSIAAYKAPEIVRLLKKQNKRVITVLTKSAEAFVSQMVLENLSEEKCYTDNDLLDSKSYHLSLARQGDMLIIAPASTNTIAKCVHGIADSLLANIFLTFKGPILIAPAMHTEMYEHKTTQKNLKEIKNYSHIIGPGFGELACNDVGIGRMVSPNLVADASDFLFFPKLNLKGKKILITIGGTQENIDDVRLISNNSTGQLGKAIALLAQLSQADISIVSTVDIDECGYKQIHMVNTAEEMKEKVDKLMPTHDTLIMAAAVSDFTVENKEKKIKRDANKTLELKATTDILKFIAKKNTEKQIIGFCLSDKKTLEKNAISKCKEKNCDYIIANPLDSFGKDKRSILICNKEKKINSYEDISIQKTAYEILKLIK